MFNNNQKPLAAKEKKGSALLWRIEDEKYILLARHDMYILNVYAKEIFDLCDGNKTIQQIADYCKDKYVLDDEFALNKVKEFVEFFVGESIMTIN